MSLEPISNDGPMQTAGQDSTTEVARLLFTAWRHIVNNQWEDAARVETRVIELNL